MAVEPFPRVVMEYLKTPNIYRSSTAESVNVRPLQKLLSFSSTFAQSLEQNGSLSVRRTALASAPADELNMT